MTGNAAVVAVASERGGCDRARAFAGKFGLSRGHVYAKYGSMIDDRDVEAVYIATVTRKKKEVSTCHVADRAGLVARWTKP